MAFTIAALAVVSAAATAYTTYQSYQAQKNEANYARQVAENNALAAKQQAQYEAETKERQVQRQLAQQRAAIAANGTVTDVGSPLALELDSAYQGYRDVAARLWEGEARATAYGNEATYQKFRANTYAKNALPAAFIGGISAGVGSYLKMGGPVPTSMGGSSKPVSIGGGAPGGMSGGPEGDMYSEGNPLYGSSDLPRRRVYGAGGY